MINERAHFVSFITERHIICFDKIITPLQTGSVGTSNEKSKIVACSYAYVMISGLFLCQKCGTVVQYDVLKMNSPYPYILLMLGEILLWFLLGNITGRCRLERKNSHIFRLNSITLLPIAIR
jgi:hypothetical protein